MSASSANPPLPALGPILLRLALGLVLLIGVILLLGSIFRPELESFGRAFVARFGLFAFVFGSLIADGLHFPVPPQFYMLMGITSGMPGWLTLTSVSIGSVLGSWLAFFGARHVARVDWIDRRLVAPRQLLDYTLARYGTWSLIIASFLPITYAALCYLAGVSRLSPRGFAVIVLIRVPRLIAYYYVVRLGWHGL